MEYNIKHVRIDDRLVHGQVATTWTKVLGIEQIIIVDDEANNNPIQRNIADLAAPPGVEVKIFGVDQFIKIIEANPIKKVTMLIFANPINVLKVVKLSNLNIDSVNAGGMQARDGRKKLSQAVYISEEENEVFKKMMDMGINIEIKKVPSDRVEPYVDPFI